MTSVEQRPTLTLLDRDLSWLEFNGRVLHEAADERTPLLERLKFLAIVGSNLDEFFMKRMGVLTRNLTAPEDDPVAYKQLQVIREKALAQRAEQARIFVASVRPALARAGIHLLDWSELNDDDLRQANELFRRKIFPVLTPLIVDPAHPFPFLSNLSRSLGILLQNPSTGATHFARVKVPDHVPAWIRLEPAASENHHATGTFRYFRLLDLIRANLEGLFPEMHLAEIMAFRVIRSAEVEDDEEAAEGSLLEQVTEELRQRRLERVVVLEFQPPGSGGQLELLAERLGLDPLQVHEAPGELDSAGLMPLAFLPRSDLRDHAWEPVVPAPFTESDRSIFSLIRAGDVLVHHPYESFDATTARFIRSACEDPHVLAIKMTVYRIGSDTPFIDNLARAAEAGKQVACLVEVTARFDEHQNLVWAQTLEKVGVHVVYGLLGLKTHSKVTLVVRNEADGIRCYAHLGTGNYHVKTARLYTDLGLLTCDPVLTADVVELFHALTGGAKGRNYAKLLVAPVNMRQRFLALIEREIAHAQAGRPARIVAKLNQLEDRAVCAALVQASQAGVNIDLIVRGFCVLPPGVPGETENVRVTSVIGRFLEHSRIYYFQNGARDPVDGDFYIGSADWMERNLSRRVEAITPIETPALRQRLWQILQISLDDCRQAWEMHSDGTYTQRMPSPRDGAHDPANLGTQEQLMALALRAGRHEAS